MPVPSSSGRDGYSTGSYSSFGVIPGTAPDDVTANPYPWATASGPQRVLPLHGATARRGELLAEVGPEVPADGSQTDVPEQEQGNDDEENDQ